MPELPEVETVRRSLQPLLQGCTITNVEIPNQVVTLPDVTPFRQLTGAVFDQIERRGKYLLFHFTDGRIMTAHLRMTGKLVCQEGTTVRVPHTHAVFCCDNGKELRFVDVRRFGRLWLLPETEIPGLHSLGMEPIAADFCGAVLQASLAKHPKSKIKGAILDQHVVAGLGNIYADESLFAAQLHPLRVVASLTEPEINRLAIAMTETLTGAIANRGTSFRDYVDGNGEKGTNQNWLKVFLREGQPCPCCGQLIERIKVVGRSSYYCPHCQLFA